MDDRCFVSQSSPTDLQGIIFHAALCCLTVREWWSREWSAKTGMKTKYLPVATYRTEEESKTDKEVVVIGRCLC
jgi:hypothetical protein